jgi:hypothetical protein
MEALFFGAFLLGKQQRSGERKTQKNRVAQNAKRPCLDARQGRYWQTTGNDKTALRLGKRAR